MSYLAKTALLSVASLLKCHFTFFFHALNPVKSPLENRLQTRTTLSSKEQQAKNCQAKRRSVQLHSSFAIFAHLLTLLVGLVGFELYYVGTFSLEQLGGSPFIYCHQFTPASSWAQIDLAFSQDITASVLLFIALIRRPEIGSGGEEGGRRWCIYRVRNSNAIWIDSQKLSADESKEVLAFLRTVRRILLPLMAVYYLYEIFALLSQVWINDVYEVSLWMAVFWLVAVPGQMFYLFNSIFGSIIYVAIVSKVIRVQQRALIEIFADLTTAALYLLIIAFFELFLLFIIGLCAKVVRLNGAFERANRRFYLRWIFFQRSSTKVLNQKQLADGNAEVSGRLSQYAFRVVLFTGDYVITSNTIHMAMGWMLTAFIFVHGMMA
ncbi:hypothetical protein TYRP_017015 [Tyrophagus putrescentiae]|nr:hypothetical protein TYRP_017015 [Tyrophagus putrescentiae]